MENHKPEDILGGSVEHTQSAMLGLVTAIERLCLENEILGLMLQDYWTEKRSWQGALHESANRTELRNPIHAAFAEVASASLGDVPPSCFAIFESLTKAIGQTRSQSSERIADSKKPLN